MHLFPAYSGEPLQVFIDCCAMVKVFEERSNLYARAAETPDPADPAGVLINGTTMAPIHAFILAPELI